MWSEGESPTGRQNEILLIGIPWSHIINRAKLNPMTENHYFLPSKNYPVVWFRVCLVGIHIAVPSIGRICTCSYRC